MSEVIVIGAGPVGLFLGLRLHQLGVRPTLIERRRGAREDSRSIGIHPPALERLDRLGVGGALVQRGVRVRRGLAFEERRPLGELSFEGCPGPHRYVLTVPQRTTEAVLREALEARVPGAIVEGAEVVDVTVDGASVTLATSDGRALSAPYAVACDGRRSACRGALGVAFEGAAYPGRYAMCDAPETTTFGDRAAIFLGEGGLVESFPLPGGTRRWVARVEEDDAPAFAGSVERRTGWRVPVERASGFSTFVAERFLARTLYRSRVALAGDAAHVISPIGGQGLNVGWLGAWDLAEALARAIDTGDDAPLHADARRRRRMVRTAARRAELNMWLGRPGARRSRPPLVRALLRRPIADGLARLFTMRALEAGL